MDKHPYVLIVEDSMTQAQQLESILSHLGYTCIIAVNAGEALDLIKNRKPLIVVADILMPEMDGYELCRQIKSDIHSKEIPVVLLTRLSEPKEVMKGLACGADDFLVKQYNEDIILNRIQTILSIKQRQESVNRNITILIVEDSPTQAEQLRFLLEEAGYTVVSAVNGKEGFDLAKKIRPAAVITDIIMPVMDGYELASKIKLDESLKNTPVIFVTSLKDSSQVVLRVSVVADGFFTKPYDEKYLLSKVESLISASQQNYEHIELKGVEIVFEGERFVINSGVRQVVNFLLSTYEGAIRQNRDLKFMQRELQNLNQSLETKVKERTQKLKSSEENFRALAENLSDGIIISNIEGRHIYSNISMLLLSGYSVDEFVNKSFKDIIIPVDVPKVAAKIKRAQEDKAYPIQYETSIVTKDKREIPVELTVTSTKWEDESAAIVIVRDISERKKRVEDLIKKDKLDSVGVLAGGIAHDFNNLLTGILGNVSLAKMSCSAGDKTYNLLSDAEKATFRARDLTRQLLTFSKGGTPLKQASSIADILRESASFAARGSNVRCMFSLPDDLRLVDVDSGQFSQIIHNLVINAVQAMRDGGEISLSAENADIGTKDNIPVSDGKYIKITIKDTGTGIPADHLTKIFDPYFTTKEFGTGLGLATVYSIVKNHAGYITVDSAPDKGTSFFIYLPASSKDVPDITARENEIISGNGRILIMDDEDIIRDVADEMLSRLGYEVSCAKDGTEAIEMYRKAREAGRPFDAVIMDLTIPGGMGGTEAIKILHEIDPAAKAIVSSGYSNDEIISEYREHGFIAYITKPYRFTELSRIVHQVVTGKSV
ncbi:MAG: response regulator [Nitrospira sp.]|nr:response regulator [Nitrospira sp.]